MIDEGVKMKLTVLGRWGAFPKAGEATSGYLLDTGNHKILIDCGSGVLANLFKHIRSEELDAVFISHFHYDHTADLGCLLYATRIAMGFKRRNDPLIIYACSQNPLFSKLTYLNHTKGLEINPNIELNLDGLKISFKQTVHDEYNLAMKFEYGNKVLVYTGDMGFEPNFFDFCTKADLLVCETSLFEDEEGLFKGHMTSRQAATLAQKANVKKLLLTHFPHQRNIFDLATESSKYFNGVIKLAEINKTYEV